MADTTTFRKVRSRPQQVARCSRSKTQYPAKRTATVGADAFLKHRFQPFWGIATGDKKKTEREFFSSLSHLCQLYGWQQPEVAELSFPENIHSALQEMQQKFKATDLDCIIIADKQRTAALATVKTFQIGMTLYYIPVRPLWNMLTQKTDEIFARLLTQLFSYCHGVAGIPFFNRSGYLCNTYDYMQNMIDDSEEEDEVFRELQQEEMATLRKGTDELFLRIKQNFSLQEATELLRQYRHMADCQKEVADFCDDFLAFAADFPARNLYQNRSSTLLFDSNTEYIYYDQYLSFYWSGEDGFTDLLMDIVNADLQEISEMQQPISMQYFDTEQLQEQHSFEYETRLFNLLDKLIELLNQYDHEKHQ